jgi:hypothetical protein
MWGTVGVARFGELAVVLEDAGIPPAWRVAFPHRPALTEL